MNDLISLLILAVVQGITEWLPVSSSGHLVLLSSLLHFESSLVFDVALHFGTLMAVFVYFGKEITDIMRDLFHFKFKTSNGRLGLLILIATIPAGFFGYFFKSYVESAFGNLKLVSIGFFITGLVLLIASIDFKKNKKNLSFKEAFLVGLAQSVALFPGISRSGATISTGLILGLNEKDAIKFSFLMFIPVTIGATILTIGNNILPKDLIWATLVSFVVGLTTIHALYTKILKDKKNLKWLAIYVFIIAVICLVI
jgi:undecaprenyl-diphosphatase